MGADTSILILDDTEGVWPQHAANLIQVDRYIFFPACATRFGRSHKCLLETGQDEDADKGMLSTSLRVLKQVHTTLFQVKLCAAALRGTGLSRCSSRSIMGLSVWLKSGLNNMGYQSCNVLDLACGSLHWPSCVAIAHAPYCLCARRWLSCKHTMQTRLATSA